MVMSSMTMPRIDTLSAMLSEDASRSRRTASAAFADRYRGDSSMTRCQRMVLLVR